MEISVERMMQIADSMADNSAKIDYLKSVIALLQKYIDVQEQAVKATQKKRYSTIEWHRFEGKKPTELDEREVFLAAIEDELLLLYYSGSTVMTVYDNRYCGATPRYWAHVPTNPCWLEGVRESG